MTGVDRIEEAAELLRSGHSLADVQRLLLPESWQRALRVCAASEVLTTDLFDSVLRRYAQPEAPQLADLAKQGLIEALSGTPTRWRVPRAEATRWMRDWNVGQSGTNSGSKLVHLETELADWYAEHNDRNEQLRHLLVADTQRAVSLFRQMFGDADDKRDFARCQDLLEVLGDHNRITFAGPDVSELRLDRAGYLRTRLYWSVDYSRSAQYLTPPGLGERTERLLSDSGPRVWQLYAPGGTGKTVQLQWLVARYCVTPSIDIPCARIDFDVVDPVNLTRYPWLLLLEVADQLDRRWPRRAFERLDRFLSYRSLARRLTSELTREAASGLGGLPSKDVERQVTEIFVRRFNRAAAGRPIVLIVDTLEEIMLGGAGDPGRLLRLLADLVRDCPALRLILAGRYDLRELAPQTMAALEPAESVELRDFTPDQVKAYLGKIRGIGDPALQDAVVLRTGGQPFLVALFADVIGEHPEISPSELARQRDPATQLLIDRVIRRIANPDVRWLVRYGVVPRRLRFHDVATIMRPFMARGRSGPSSWDDPRTDQHHLSGYDDIFPFGTSPRDEAELTAVWQRLLSYAAERSWVSPADEGQSVVFHPNVRGPMRDLISHRPVFRELHETFRRRFEQLAEESPLNRSAYLREAVYHRVQVADPGAADFWRMQVKQCRDSGDLKGVEELADELLRDDYVDNGMPRQRSDGQPLLPYEMLEEAYAFKAYAAAERARAVQAEASDPLWSDVRRSLFNAVFVREQSPEPVAASPLEGALRVALLITDSKIEEAVASAERAVAGASGDSQVDLLRVLGDALAARGDPAAVATYRRALKAAHSHGRADQVDAITFSLASQAEAVGRLDRAVLWVRPSGDSAAGSVAHVERALLHSRLLIERYQPTAALHMLTDLHVPDLSMTAEIAYVRAEAYLLLGRADHALGELAAVTVVAEEMPQSARYAHLAQAHQLRGVVLGELLALEEAEDSFQLAIGLWGEIGFSEGHPECSYLYRSFLIESVGDIGAASQLPRPPMEEGSEQELLWEEQTADLQALQARDPTPLVEPDSLKLPPRQAARLIASRLARSWRQHSPLVPTLIDTLKRIRPTSARLLVLKELRRCEHADADDIRRLGDVLTAPRRTGSADDIALQRCLLAELDRLKGDHLRAQRDLEKAIDGLPPSPAARLMRWRWLQARSRLRAPIDPVTVRPLLDASEDYPLLRAAGLLTLTLQMPHDQSARPLLEEAVAYCERTERPNRWAAEIFRALGRRTGDESMLAMAGDMDRQLGRARGPFRPSQILEDRHGEQVLSLSNFGRADPAQLQRRLVVEWPSLAHEMGDVLFGDPTRFLWGPELAALRLESDNAEIQALPWELAIPPAYAALSLGRRWPGAAYRTLPDAAARIDTRWLQRALCSSGLEVPIDGVLGPITLNMLGRFSPLAIPPVQSSTRMELERLVSAEENNPPLAFVLRPEPSVESVVSSHWDSGFDVADLYTGLGLRAMSGSHLAEITPQAGRDQVRVLHITARMDMRGAGPYFDFSPAEMPERLGSKARGTDIRPKDIGRWLRACSPGREPLIVLDPPHPGSPYDVPWQIVLRNLFAAMLFAEAGTPVIIATGVQTRGLDYITPIARGLTEKRPLASIASDLRSFRDAPAEHILPSESLGDSTWGTVDDTRAAQATAVFAAPSAFTLALE